MSNNEYQPQRLWKKFSKLNYIEFEKAFYNQLEFGECWFKINNEEPVLLRLDPLSKEVQELILKTNQN